MTSLDNLRQLQRIAQMRSDGALGALADIRRRESACLDEIAARRQTLASVRHDSGADFGLTARIELFERWAAKEIERAQNDLKGLQELRAEQHAKAAHAFARADVLRRLHEQLSAAEIKKRR